jgi:hypothetical protein
MTHLRLIFAALLALHHGPTQPSLQPSLGADNGPLIVCTAPPPGHPRIDGCESLLELFWKGAPAPGGPR